MSNARSRPGGAARATLLRGPCGLPCGAQADTSMILALLGHAEGISRAGPQGRRGSWFVEGNPVQWVDRREGLKMQKRESRFRHQADVAGFIAIFI